MIDDKKLEKMLRRQVKTGLTIYVGGDEIAFVSSNWMARTTMERLREKLRITLGALVEMLGFIPEDGAIRIRKTKDGYDVQEEMKTVAANQIGTFLDAELWPVKRTMLSYGWARELWQTRSGKLYGQTADRVDDGGNNAWLNGAGCLVLRDFNNTEEQYIKVSRPEENVAGVPFALWQHLEQVMWTDWSDSPPQEEEPEEQIVLALPAPEEEPEEPEIPLLPPAEEREDDPPHPSAAPTPSPQGEGKGSTEGGRSCYTCEWCGDGEEVDDHGHCWLHNGEDWEQPPRDIGCDEWAPRDREGEDGSF